MNSGRHMFWQAPPMGRLRTVPLRGGGRPVMMGGSLFMGDAAPASTNRLDQVSIPAIIGRIQLQPTIAQYIASPPAYETVYGGTSGGGAGGFGGFGRRALTLPMPNFPPITDAEKQILFEVSKNPTEEELKDLATIDNLFNQNFNQSYTTTMEVCYLVHEGYKPRGFTKLAPQIPTTGQAGAEYALIKFFHPPTPTGRFAKAPTPPDSSFTGDKFWCPDPTNNQPTTYLNYVPVFGPSGSFAGMFNIDVNKTWGEEKLAVKNGLTMLGVKASYPLPPPLDIANDYVWSVAAGPHLAEMAHIGGTVDPEVFRMWYTMAVLASYDSASDYIIAVQKKKAKKAKRKAILKAVAFTIAGIVLSFIVPGIIAAAITAIKAAVDLYIQAKQRAEAAKAMQESAKMFEADAPAFAAEVQKAADMLDSAAAQEEANTPLTQEQLDAIQEVKDNPEPNAPPTTGQALVVGGTAIGIVAAMLAIFKR